MNPILLLGAGFSRNWGGRLSTEVRAELQSVLHADQYLSRLVQQHDFERALSIVQGDHDQRKSSETQQQLRMMQDAISGVFGRMNAAFLKRPSMEFGNDIAFSIRKYLTKFDAIFTLNQDLLVEFKHRPDEPGIWYGSKFGGYEIPAMREVRPPDAPMEFDRVRSKWHPTGDNRLNPRMQPYFKLHGSSQWETSDATPMLVIGSAKVRAIDRFVVLRWYWEQFLSYLSLPDTQLVVIGYGFADEHINSAILHAAAKGSLRMFVVHPQGRAILVRQSGAMIPPPEPLRDDVPSLGESTRPLSSTFLDDELERDLLYRVIAP